VQEGCKKILVSDYFNLHEKLVSMQQRGISIDGEPCHENYKSDSLASDYVFVANETNRKEYIHPKYTHFINAFSVTWYIALDLNFQLVKI
jgi:hypothetical protein